MPHASPDHNLPPVHDTAVRAEQVRILYGTLGVQLMNLVNAPIVAALLWPIYPAWVLLSWVGLFVVVVAARVLLWRSYRHETSDENAGRWAGRFTLGAIVTGSLWGCLGSTVFMTEDPTYYVFVAFVLGGMTAGAAMRDTPHLPAFYGFAIPAVVPMIVAFLAKGLLISVEMGLLLTAFTVVLVVMGRDYHRWIIDGLRLKIEQATLNRDLQRITGELEQEVADRERIAAALKESNERLSGIGENAQDPIIITDSDGNVVYWNPAAERTFGYKADEIMGHSAHRLLAADRFRQTAVDRYNHFAVTGQGEFLGKTVALAAIRKDGTEFPIDLSISAMPHGSAWHAVGIARDVSDRVKVEIALKEREAELNEAQRLSHVGNWIWHPTTDKIEWSDEMYRIFGQDPALPLPGVQEHSRFMKPDSFERLQAALAACRDTGKPYEIELGVLLPDGTTAFVLARGEAVRGPDGKIVSVRGTAHDITERLLADEKTREQEAMFRGLVEQGMVGIFIIAEDETVAYLNPRFAAMLGIKDASEAIGRPILDFAAEADKATARYAILGLFSGKRTTVEVPVTLLPKHGGKVDVLAQGTLATFQGKRAIIAVVLDISERRRSEEKIANLNAQMTATVAVLRRHERDQSTIAKLSDLLQSCQSRAEAFPIIATTAANLFPNTNGALSHVKSGTREVDTVVQWGEDQTTLPQFSFDDCWGCAAASATRSARLAPARFAAISNRRRPAPMCACRSRRKARPADCCTSISRRMGSSAKNCVS